MATETRASTVPHWINGEETAATGSRQGNVTNAATGMTVRTVPFANAADVDLAVQAATAAYPGWRATTPLREGLKTTYDAFQKELDEGRARVG